MNVACMRDLQQIPNLPKLKNEVVAISFLKQKIKNIFRNELLLSKLCHRSYTGKFQLNWPSGCGSNLAFKIWPTNIHGKLKKMLGNTNTKILMLNVPDIPDIGKDESNDAVQM